MEAEQKALESTIRAIVQSSKGTVTVKELERKYFFFSYDCDKIL